MSFFRYPGGKSKISDHIIATLDKAAEKGYDQFREPFFGGGSIGIKFIAKNKVKNVWINDKDYGIDCLWNSVILYPKELRKMVTEFRPTVEEFYRIKEDLLRVDDAKNGSWEKIVKHGFEKLAIHQISYSGLGTKSGGPLGGSRQESKYKIDCRWSPKYICKKIDALHSLFSEAKVDWCSNFDFGGLIENKDSKSLIYLDPPYFKKGNDLYQFGFSVADHERLSKLLRETEHSWVLSYDDCEEIRDFYSWADIQEIGVNYSITALKDKETGDSLSRTKNELIICGKR
jgi:DNA adenine methylase